MGKTKGQRTKGNLQPSSSAKAAELVAKTSGNLPGHFFILSKYLKTQDDEADVSSPSDTEFYYVLKKLSKKDVNTKKKGLQEFKQLCSEKELDVLIVSLPYWVPLYMKLSLDNDRWVRELCQESFQKLAERVKNKLAPHLKDIMGTWLMAQCDGHVPSASLARNTFETLFKEMKQSEAVWFCKAEVIKFLLDVMFNTTKASIKDSDICEEDEIEGRLVRLQTASIDALSRFVKLSDLQYGDQVTVSLNSFLNHTNFWKFHKHQSPNVKRAFFDLMATLCDRGTFGDDSLYREQVVRSVLLSIDESNPHVIPALWKAVVSVCTVKDCWSLINMRKAFLPKLYSFLEMGGHGYAEITHPNIIIIIDKLPQELKAEEKFNNQFLDKLRKSLKQSCVLNSYRESDAIVKTYVECCKYIIFNHIEKTELPSLVSASMVIKDQIMALLGDAFKETRKTLTCSFRHVSEFLWYLLGMSSRCGDGRKSSSLWMHVFKTTLDELSMLSISLVAGSETQEEHLERLILFFQTFLSCQNNGDPFGGQKYKKWRKIVTFDVAQANGEKNECEVLKKSNMKFDDEIKEAYKTHEVFKNFVHYLSAVIYSKISLAKPLLGRMKFFRVLFEQFACSEFLEALKPQKEDPVCDSASPEKPSIHCFLTDVVCPWMAAADPTMLSEVTGIFLAALCLESEQDRMNDFELALDKLDQDLRNRSRMYKYLSVLFGTSSAQLVNMWTASKKCNELIKLSVTDCINNFMRNVAHEESWNVLCVVLTKDETEKCPISKAKYQLLVCLKEHLLNFMRGSQMNHSFDFIQILLSHLLEANSIFGLISCEAFDWFLDMLLWSSLGIIPKVSSDVCLASRKTFISILDVLLSIDSETQKNFEDSKLALRIKRILLSCASDVALEYDQLEDSVKTSQEILKLFFIHFENFSFFSNFVSPSVCKIFDLKPNEKDSIEAEELVQKLYQFSHKEFSVETVKSHVFNQTFYAKVFNALFEAKEKKAIDPESDLEEELNPNQTGVSGDPASLQRSTVDEKNRLMIIAPERINGNARLTSYINEVLDCIGFLTFCNLPSKKEMLEDLMNALHNLVPILDEKSARGLIVGKIECCMLSSNDYELNVGCISLFIVLKKVADVGHLHETLMAESNMFLGRIMGGTNINVNILKVVMALLCISPEKNVQEIFNKCIDLIAETPIENDKDLNDFLLNLFFIINTILSINEHYMVFVPDELSNDTESTRDVDNPCTNESGDVNPCTNQTGDDDNPCINPNFVKLLKAVSQVKQFCEGLFDEGVFNKDINKFNMLVINFYKNVLSKFQTCPKVIAKHWDDMLCFTVSRFEGMLDVCRSPNFEFSQEFELFLETILSLSLQMIQLFDSNEFAETSPGLADEWKNVFQPTLYEYLIPFFVGTASDVGTKNFQYLNVLELLCAVISQCPLDHLHFLSSAPLGDDNDHELLFELLCPLVASQTRCIKVTAHALLKKIVPRKAKYLQDKFTDDSNESSSSSSTTENEQQQTDDVEDSHKYTNPSIFVPSLIALYTNILRKLEEFFPEESMLYGSFPMSAIVGSNMLSYLLIFDVIMDIYKHSPVVVKRSLSSWFSDNHVAYHMMLLSSIMPEKFSEDLIQTAFKDFYPKICTNPTPSFANSFCFSVGCESGNGVDVTLRRKLKDDECMSRWELEELSFRIFVKTVHSMPRIVRLWYSDLDQKSALLVDKFVTKNVSPAYIAKELCAVQQVTSSQSGLNFQVKAHGRELMAIYSAEDATVTLVVNFPDNYPLNCLKVSLDHNRITSVKQLSSAWLLQLTKLLNYKDGTLMDALTTLGRSLDRHFDGNSCMICFSLVLTHQGTKVLPKIQCKTCKKRFHNVCLFTWFKSSHNAACPLCRSTF